MKDLSKKIREGGVQKFSSNQLGVNQSGKGDFPRFSYQSDDEYKENYDAIDWSNGEKPNKTN
jgi:hypothetical protein